MDPRKTSAEWFRTTVFRDEAIRPRPAPPQERLPAPLRAARSLEKTARRGWQSREALFLNQGKLLANYEDDYGGSGDVVCYYPTYQALTDRQLRAYFSWRTKLRRGDVREAPLSFAFLYIYELLNQIGAADPMDGYRKLMGFRDAYGGIDRTVLPYLERWMADYVVYYGLDRNLLAGTPLAALHRDTAVLGRVREEDPAQVMEAVGRLSKWLGRSKFYGDHTADMDQVTVQVLRRMSGHCDARCKKSLVDQYFGSCGPCAAYLFDTAVFCDPLKRTDYHYVVDGEYAYSCKDGRWFVRMRGSLRQGRKKLDALLKTVDSIMREAYGWGRPVKAELDTKWVVRIIREEVSGLLARQRAAEASKVAIDFGRLTQIRRDAAATRDKLIVDEELDPPAAPAPPEPEPTPPAPDAAPGEAPLSPPEYRLLQCLLYGGDTGWVQREGHLLSVLADGINETLYDTFLDCVLDGTPQVVPDYIDELKGMVRP